MFKVSTGNGMTSINTKTLLTSTTERPVALAAGEFCAGAPECAGDELATALTDGTTVKIWSGDGTTTTKTGAALYSTATNTVNAMLGGKLGFGRIATAFGRANNRFAQVVFGDGAGTVPVIRATAHSWP